MHFLGDGGCRGGGGGLSFICKVGLSDGEVDKRLQCSPLLEVTKECCHQEHKRLFCASMF